MQFLKTAMVAASVVSLCGLVACGGGNDPDSSTPNRFGQGVAAPANTVEVITSTSAAPATGSYPLDTGYTNASGLVNITGHVIEWVSPESTPFDSVIFFSQNDPRKFAVGLFNSFPERAYRCVSAVWSSDELLELAEVFGIANIASVQKCPSNITIDAAGHHVSFSNWTLLSDDLAESMKVSLNVSWSLQNGTLNPPGGSGSGSTSSGSVISTGGSISLPPGSLGISIREQTDLSSLERNLELSNSR